MQMTEFVTTIHLLKTQVGCKNMPIPLHPGAARG